jgi:serine/threonine-protein kinase
MPQRHPAAEPLAAPTSDSPVEDASPPPAVAGAGRAIIEEHEPPPAAEGWLLVLVEPWGEVTLDGEVLGHTPLARMALSPGEHDVTITHPDFRPWRRRVRIVAGETFEVAVNLRTDAVRRSR